MIRDRVAWVVLAVSVVIIMATARADIAMSAVCLFAWAGGIASYRLYQQWVGLKDEE